MTRRLAAAGLAFVVLFAVSCASGGAAGSGSGSSAKKDRGFKTLEATVVDRERNTSYTGTAIYYLVFEAKEGDATARYRFEVSAGQWNRLVEGSHVQLSIADNRLRDVRLIP
ncbi:MAG: hypothetical protein ABI592_16335 [Acidobacteriota bacterium]